MARTKSSKATNSSITKRAYRRRSAYEVVQELKSSRNTLAETYETRLAKLDEKIAKMEERHALKLAVSEVLSTKSPEEIEAALKSMKAQQRILKQALKKANA